MFENVLRRYGKFNEPGVRLALASALLFKGLSLEKLDRPDEAVAAYEELEHRFSEDSDEIIQDDIREARERKRELPRDGSPPH